MGSVVADILERIQGWKQRQRVRPRSLSQTWDLNADGFISQCAQDSGFASNSRSLRGGSFALLAQHSTVPRLRSGVSRLVTRRRGGVMVASSPQESEAPSTPKMAMSI